MGRRKKRNKQKVNPYKKKRKQLVEGEVMWRCRVNNVTQKMVTRRNVLWQKKAERKGRKLYNKKVGDVALA